MSELHTSASNVEFCLYGMSVVAGATDSADLIRPVVLCTVIATTHAYSPCLSPSSTRYVQQWDHQA